jgi:hypothetical protein
MFPKSNVEAGLTGAVGLEVSAPLLSIKTAVSPLFPKSVAKRLSAGEFVNVRPTLASLPDAVGGRLTVTDD